MATVLSTNINQGPISAEDFQDMAFPVLARYIGVFGNPENITEMNKKAEPIAMTAPVIMRYSNHVQNTIAGGERKDSNSEEVLSMSFVLPSKYIKQNRTPPTPLNKCIQISRVASRRMAVKRFSGYLTRDVATLVFQEMYIKLSQARDVKVKKNASGIPVWESMAYNAPYVPPEQRTNEIAVWLQD